MIKKNEFNIKNIESLDISNLLELTLSNVNYSKTRIVHYTFLIEEALKKWRENLPKENSLKYNVKRTKKNISFTFSIEGEKCNPFIIQSKADDENAPIDKMIDKLLSGVGAELKYSYKKNKNQIKLKLPINCDYEKILYRKNLIFFVLPIAIQQIFLCLTGNIDSFMLGFIDANAMSATSLVTKFSSIADCIGSIIAITGIAILSQYWGERNRENLNDSASIILKMALFSGSIFAICSFFFPKSIVSLYTDDSAIIEQGTLYLRVIAFPIFLSILIPTLNCFMQVMGYVKKIMIFSVVACTTNVILNGVFIFGLFGLPQMGVFGAGIATVISFSLQTIMLLIYVFSNKEIKIKFITHNKALLTPILKLLLPYFFQSMVWVVTINIMASCYGHLGADIVASYAIISFILNSIASVCIGFRNGTAIWIGRLLGRKEFSLAKIRANQSLSVTAISYIFIVPLFILSGIAIHILPIDLNDNALKFFDIMLLVSIVNTLFKYLNSVIVSGILQPGGDIIPIIIIDIVCFGFILAGFSLLVINNVLTLPPMLVVSILCADEIISFPFKFIRFKKCHWLKSTVKN